MSLDHRSLDRDAALPQGARVGVVVSLYHEELTLAMVESARARLREAGLAEEDLLVYSAPGAFELPLLAQRLAGRADVDCVLCFGLVLKGETAHDEYVAGAAMRGLVEASLSTGKPILFGVLTCANLEQARARALPPERGGRQDKGREVATAAIQALATLRRIERDGKAGEGEERR
jgi:6,7-dimethyl-8-ribityllumazine synthase